MLKKVESIILNWITSMGTKTPTIMVKKNKVAIGLSGGVDSSVAAFLLKEAGYEVIGLHLKLHDGMEALHSRACCSLDASLDARMVADRLQIPFYVLNLKAPFQEKVIEPFIEEYRRGRTPNPCIECNRYIKFGVFLGKAMELGAEYLATGHYASIYQANGRWCLRRAKDQSKDQTYMLYGLSQSQLSRTLMPLGELESKKEVRRIADQLKLPSALNPDSQEICFIPEDDHVTFLKEHIQFTPGNFVLKNGGVLGKHQGMAAYTIGQRKGLGIAYDHPLYVTSFDHENNQIILGKAGDVFSSELEAESLNFICDDPPCGVEVSLEAKVRHSLQTIPCVMTRLTEDHCRVRFLQPVRAVTPGQSVVFYRGEDLYGGGIIQESH